jgi:hypothetical protein
MGFHSDLTTFAWVVILGYPGREIGLHGPFDEFDAQRFSNWITDSSGVPSTVLNITSVTTSTLKLAEFHAARKES